MPFVVSFPPPHCTFLWRFFRELLMFQVEEEIEKGTYDLGTSENRVKK